MGGVTLTAGAVCGVAAAVLGLPWSLPLLLAGLFLLALGVDLLDQARARREAVRRAERRGGWLL